MRLFQSDHPGLELHELTTEHLEEWLGNRRKVGVSDSTVQKNMHRLNSLLDWAWRKGLVKGNPAEYLARTVYLNPQPVKKHTWLKAAEVQRVLDSIDILTSQDHRDALILRLGFIAGLRNNEIRTLPLSGLERIEEQRISLKGKRGKLAQVWVSDKTAELLIAWRDAYRVPEASLDPPVVIGFRNVQDWNTGERILTPQWGVGISQQTLGRIVGERTSAAGHRIAPHDMRRSYAGIVYEKGGLEKTSHALRHSNLATTQIYIEGRQDAAAVAVEAVGLGIR